jgi:hypothetical protein
MGSLFFLTLGAVARSQALYQPDPAEVKARVAEVLRFYQLADKATRQDAEQLVELETKVETPGIEMRDRLQAYLQLYRLLYRLNGVESPPADSLNNGARTSAGVFGSFIIWGKLVPWNRVWRTGANEATTINFSRDALVEGNRLAAGTYSLFTIPSESEWTVIFNRVAHQWGAFNYNPEIDALRLKVKPQTAEPMEWLGFSFDPTGEKSANLTLRWEKLKLQLKIEDAF